MWRARVPALVPGLPRGGPGAALAWRVHDVRRQLQSRRRRGARCRTWSRARRRRLPTRAWWRAPWWRPSSGGITRPGGHLARTWVRSWHARARSWTSWRPSRRSPAGPAVGASTTPACWQMRWGRSWTCRRSRPCACVPARPTGARGRPHQDLPLGAIQPVLSLAGRHVLLVDDVLTTGATVRAAARAAHDGGAGQVHVAVLARAAG
jgi:hypothetical protein